MDTRIVLGGVAVVIIAAIALIAFLPGSGIMKSVVPQNSNVPSSLTAVSSQIKPLSISYNGTSVVNATYRDASLKTTFYVTNPNTTTVILESITYELQANGIVIGHGQIGQRYEGSWESSYYFPLIGGTSNSIDDTAVIKNTGNYPDVWTALQQGTAKITVSGTAYYATKTAFSGSDFTEDFNFTR
ncbi:MAG TPA: hypothetical protein VJ792_10180 [Candidatus Nitrosotalea sp.]|nr:hypothetical protein [Candidatus Nitrosotalea sp.]